MGHILAYEMLTWWPHVIGEKNKKKIPIGTTFQNEDILD